MLAIGGLLALAPLGGGVATAATNHVAWGADFDGDGLADPALYDLVSSRWQVLMSLNNYAAASTTFGGTGWVAVARDYDGDGKSDPAVYEEASGTWAVMLSAYGYAIAWALGFGGPDAVPAPADYDGDGLADPAVFQQTTPSTNSGQAGAWSVMLSGSGYGVARAVFGAAGDQPVVADYDGDGKADPALYDAASGKWKVMLSGAGYAIAELAGFGGTNWQAVAGDYDGDRKADPATYCETNGAWRFRLSLSGYAESSLAGFGGSGDTPAAADYDGDGRTDPAFYRESEAMISVRFSGSGGMPAGFQQTNVLHTATVLAAAAKAGDQGVALLYGRYTPEYDMTCLWWQVVSRDGTVLTNEPVCRESIPMPGWAAADLVVDAALEPHIFTGYYGGAEHLYKTQGVWRCEALAEPGAVGSSLLARMDGSGYYHLFSAAIGAVENGTLTLNYYSNRGGAWRTETMQFNVGPSRWLVARDFAVDNTGNAHVILSLQYHPSDDVTWPGTLYYLSNTGGAWSSEVAAYKTHSSWDSYFPNVSLAVDAGGTPAVAVRLKYNVLTGSDALSQLVYYRRTAPGTWSEAILADTADDYFGTDGGHFTGILPVLAYDSSGNAHIIFSDLASSHISGYESASWGQIRYARCVSGAWSLATLFRQSAAADDGIMSKYFMLAADGRTLDVVARIYPNDDCIVYFSSTRRNCFYFQ
jgi:hypothetical protein